VFVEGLACLVKWVDCGKCGAPLSRECGSLGLCSNCVEVLEAEEDLEFEEG
jgi:hypothetical protein